MPVLGNYLSVVEAAAVLGVHWETVKRLCREGRIPELRLTGHGYDEEQAKESLRRGVAAWCAGLQSMGKLEKVLNKQKINYEDDGHSLNIDLRPNDVTVYT